MHPGKLKAMSNLEAFLIDGYKSCALKRLSRKLIGKRISSLSYD